MKLYIWGDGSEETMEVESKTLDRLSLVRETEHYTFRFAPGSLAEREIEDISGEQERVYGKLVDLFGFELPQRVEYLLTESPKENGAALGEMFGMEEAYPTNGCSIGPNYVLATYNDQIRCIGCHEDAHLFSYRLCKPKCELLSEGLAMYADGEFWGKPNEEWAREFLKSGAYVSIRELASDEKFDAIPSEITYPMAGAFVGFLMETLGKKRFLEEVYPSDMPLFDNLSGLFELPVEAVEERFVRAVKEDPHGR